jgi:hypothetical protein
LVDGVQLRYELRDFRIVNRGDETADVDLGQMEH